MFKNQSITPLLFYLYILANGIGILFQNGLIEESSQLILESSQFFLKILIISRNPHKKRLATLRSESYKYYLKFKN